MGTKNRAADPISDPKKRRRVGLSKVDAGVEANECIKIHLVSSKDEVDSPNSFLLEPVDLNHFFEEEGKIYGYEGLTITIWVSSISFHAHADITFKSTSDGGKGITDLKSALQNIFADNLVEKKDDFLQTFSPECHYAKSLVSNGEVLQQNVLIGQNGDSSSHAQAETSDVEVTYTPLPYITIVRFSEIIMAALRLRINDIMMSIGSQTRSLVLFVPAFATVTATQQAFFYGRYLCLSLYIDGKITSQGESELYPFLPLDQVIRVVGAPVGPAYCRLVPLALLLIDGSSPIDITDPRWEIYLLVQKATDQREDRRLLGFAAVYRFYRYPESLRLRLSQILVLPPYQRKGYGRLLIEALNNVAISENVYELTIEEPLDSLQHVRTYIDVERLLAFDPIQQPLNTVVSRLREENLSKKSHSCHFGPPLDAIEEVRRCFKINKKQFLQCWEILIYLGLNPIEKYMENYRTIIADSVKASVIGKDSGAAGKRLVEVPTVYDQEMSFSMFKSQKGEPIPIEMEDNSTNIEEQLRQLVDERIKEIESIAKKVSPQSS
ncbi:hypothetical protein RJ640_027334 [Escallonia rubra]|uniref:histone acetyltransferase n=1 Tax=Escallonia rubra TaxID=112253 RepID=A0AA88RBD4_9ASTE|nr:hypothetical protein RJ640_027334 [Escallonia rubra]